MMKGWEGLPIRLLLAASPPAIPTQKTQLPVVPRRDANGIILNLHEIKKPAQENEPAFLCNLLLVGLSGNYNLLEHVGVVAIEFHVVNTLS